MATRSSQQAKHETQGGEKSRAGAGGEAKRAQGAGAGRAAEAEAGRARAAGAEQDERFDPAAIKRELTDLAESLRSEFREELSQITGKVRGATSDVVESAQRTGQSALDRVRRNPMPVALTGIGLTWLLVSNRSEPQRPKYRGNGQQRVSIEEEGAEEPSRVSRVLEGAGSKAVEVKESVKRASDEVARRASQIVQNAGQSLAQAKTTVTERAGKLAQDVQSRGKELTETVGQKFEANPMLLGAAAVATGALLAALVPPTRKEDELLGNTRDSVIKNAQQLAEKALDKVQSAARKVEDTAAQLSSKT